MSTFEPVMPRWLSAASDNFWIEDQELLLAYDWDDYDSNMDGDGNWVDMTLDAAGEFPVGRMWVNPDTECIGLMEQPGCDITFLTKAALLLREFKKHGTHVLSAYTYVKNEFYCGEEQTGDLSALSST